MLSDRTIVAFDCITWFNTNIRVSQCYDLAVKPLYCDYFPILFCAVVKTTSPFSLSFSANTGQFFKRGGRTVPV